MDKKEDWLIEPKEEVGVLSRSEGRVRKNSVFARRSGNRAALAVTKPDWPQRKRVDSELAKGSSLARLTSLAG